MTIAMSGCVMILIFMFWVCSIVRLTSMGRTKVARKGELRSPNPVLARAARHLL